MKGLTSWTYLGGAEGGWETNEALAAEIARLNALIARIEDDLLLGTPVDLATHDGGQVLTGPYRTPAGEEQRPKDRVWVGSLLCGPDTRVIAAANHIPASKPDLPKIEPATNITIRVRLPAFLPSVKAYEVTESAVAPFPCIIADGAALLKSDVIEFGRVFVLRRHITARAAPPATSKAMVAGSGSASP